MKRLMGSAVGRVRAVGIMEGWSFLLLLGIAMPMKYLAGIPEAVKIAGWLHGGLFVSYCMVIFHAWSQRKLGLGMAAVAFAAALIPLGPFVLDRKLAARE